MCVWVHFASLPFHNVENKVIDVLLARHWLDSFRSLQVFTTQTPSGPGSAFQMFGLQPHSLHPSSCRESRNMPIETFFK